MTKRWRLAGLATVGVLLLGAGAFGILADLDRADKIASVVGAVAGVIALAVAGFGAASSPSGDQSVAGSTVAGHVTQVRGVQRSVRIGPGATPPTAPSPAPPAPATGAAAAPAGGQAVTRSQVNGDVHQIADVGGDVEIER